MKKNRNVFSITEIIIIVIVTGIVSSLTTGVILFSSYKYTGLGTDEALEEFVNVYAKVVDKYYEEVDKDAMINSAIDGMMDYLGDNYSIYMDKEEADSMTTQLSGEYKGVGIEILTNNEILSVFDDSPAEQAGILPGDIVLEVNGIVVSTSIETVALMGENDTSTLKLKRGEEIFEITVTSKIIDKPVVSSDVVEANGSKVGYIYISSFTKNVDAQFKEELNKIESSGIDSLVIDLRNNAGGYLDKAESIASMFLNKGKIIYSLSGKDIDETAYDKTDEKRTYEIVILINKATASASEILATAIRDSYSYGITIVGTQSYGKGKVQQTMDLGNGELIKYTTAEWLRPSGSCIDGIGIVPDVKVELPELEESDVFEDVQLARAIELLSN